MGFFDRIAGTIDELTRDAVTPTDVKEELALAAAYADRGDLAIAEERLRALAERFPKVGAVHAQLGDVQGRRGDTEAAIASYGRAVDREGDDARHWFGLAGLLAQAGRFEPARDAFRKTLALSLDGELRGQAHAALGQLYADDGHLGRAARELSKALALRPDDKTLVAAYGRVLAASDDGSGADWLARAARQGSDDGADAGHEDSAALFIEAAAATADAAAAESLLREGLVLAPTHPGLRAALARRLVRAGRTDEGLALALESLAAAPGDATVLTAVREAYAHAGRWSAALQAAGREAELGAAPPLADRIALALGAQDCVALAAVLASTAASATATDPGSDTDRELTRAARAFLQHQADPTAAPPPSDSEVRLLARQAPDAAARRFVVHALAPPPAPAGNLFALLAYAHDLATHSPLLAPLALPAARAAEALDRPLLVAVMGEFNAGKSSFVNALCGEEIAPVGVTPTTATVNVLRFGPLGGRVVYQDGTARDLGAQSVGPFLRELGDQEAATVRVVEIFYPLELLRRVEVVDTPGLNSLRPEHEKVARDFLIDADAIVWLFAVGQAAKSTEQQALRLARDAGKRVLGVLNKVDRADADEIAQVTAHTRAAVGELVDAIVPLAARRALEARRQGDAVALNASGMTAVEEALETRFFLHARELKRSTALAALGRFLTEARAAASSAPSPAADDFVAQREALAASEERLRGALATERVALRARIDEAYRGAAFEVRDFVRPRAWLFGEHRAEKADEEFLIDLLDEAITRATATTRTALVAALSAPAPTTSTTTAAAPTPADGSLAALDAAVISIVDATVDRFRAYARGVIEGGAVAEFFRQDLPRIRLDLGAIRNALARRAPDPEAALFATLARQLDHAYAEAAARLTTAEADATITSLIHDERLVRPLDDLAGAVAAISMT
ncbi:MAG TPA: dynamin family protein [Polyangia bacterium]|nr:dynamin family protein [Polyangia bacterium]